MLKYHYKIQWVIIVSILVNLPALAATDITYSVSFDGVSDRKLLSEIMAISDTISLKGRPPASINQLRRRVEGDIPNYLKLLKSKGYYGATVGTKIDSKSTPVKITFKIDTGPLYTLKSVGIENHRFVIRFILRGTGCFKCPKGTGK